MNKQEIVEHLKEKVEIELHDIEKAYAANQAQIKDGDLKNEGKYDTRATEANYLADGQRHRIQELKEELELLESVEWPDHNDNVSIGSLIDLEFNGHSKKYFIAPTGGGTMVNCGDEVVLVISVFSPIGDAALGLGPEDSFEIEIQGNTREYTILGIE